MATTDPSSNRPASLDEAEDALITMLRRAQAEIAELEKLLTFIPRLTNAITAVLRTRKATGTDPSAMLDMIERLLHESEACLEEGGEQ